MIHERPFSCNLYNFSRFRLIIGWKSEKERNYHFILTCLATRGFRLPYRVYCICINAFYMLGWDYHFSLKIATHMRRHHLVHYRIFCGNSLAVKCEIKRLFYDFTKIEKIAIHFTGVFIHQKQGDKKMHFQRTMFRECQLLSMWPSSC